VAGGLLFGFLGAIFATPLAVVVMTLVRCLYVEDTLEKGRADDRRVRARRLPAVETSG
jgi:predicted PurR-regulated permease PerM